MKKLTATAVAVAITMVLSVSACNSKENKAPDAEATSTSINWMDYTNGMAKAKEAGKPVMVDFYTTWCKWCKKLDEETYADKDIIKILNESFVSIKVNAEGEGKVMDEGKEVTEADLAKKYKVSGFPTIWFIDDKGEPIGPLPGFNSAEDLKPVLTFITSGSYAKGVAYADYLESLGQKK